MALEGRTALVTGASRGIGAAVASRLAAEGARVVLAARGADALAEVAARLPGEGHLAVRVDVSSPAGVAEALAQVIADVGHIDVLVCNAGIATSAPYHRTSEEDWAQMLAVNATSVFRLCGALLPAMVEAGWGRAVVVASNAGLTGYAYSSAYCASKHAVLGYVRAVALEVARSGVTVNAVCPGWVETDMAREAIARIARTTGKTLAEAHVALASMSPQRRLMQPEEVAGAVAYLCRDEARGIHGQALPIDGGQLL